MTLGFTYNPAGQIAGNSRSNDAYAWTNHYVLNRNYTANGLNRYTAIAGSITPTYDGRGNLTSANGATYGYNSGNMLTSASGGATLSYDPMQRLHETVGGGVTTRMAYDGATLIAEYSGSNVLQRRYVHGPGVDEPLVWYEGTGTSDRRWLHADERGSIVAISNASGAATNINAYDEYGIPRPTNVGRFQYTGQQWIAELGLYHYRARIYSPTLGRFLQTDPIGYGDGMNLYAYVGNDPVNFTDPSGLGKDQGDTPPPKCVGDYCGNTGGTIVVTGPSIPEPKAPEPPRPGVSLVVVSTGIGPNESGGGGTGEGAGSGRETEPTEAQRRACATALAIASGMIVVAIMADAEVLIAVTGAAGVRGAFVGLRGGWIGAAGGALIGLTVGYATYQARAAARVQALCRQLPGG